MSLEDIMSNLIFSLLIKFDIENDNGPCDPMCSSLYFKFKDIFLQDKIDYANKCEADFILVENNDYFDNVWLPEMKEKFPYVSVFDIIQYYKIRLMGLFAEKYDNVLFMDFDVVYGTKTPPNIFKTFDFSKGIVIRRKTYDKFADHQYTVAPNSRKAHISNFLCNVNGIIYNYDGESYNNFIYNYNTGLVGITKQYYESLNFFDHLEKNIPKLHIIEFENNYDLTKNTIRYSNEAMFTYCVLKEGLFTQNLGLEWNCDINPMIIKEHKTIKDWYFLHLSDKQYILDLISGTSDRDYSGVKLSDEELS
tara:strand:- start:774 stop:1694 length:921 start_codon:yes stop_codon:yes gene_type:complete